ncbi:PREDICTED: mucin-3A-like [Eufriesea mexicana]|uniref:mucin-3A-like n=1 Tax=Eufriesea mexicana TaxID=516756 RepID=UPI00083C39FF|nr:PREDICTED: mucin-3A-like [Eufriesea mexicana]
MGARISWLILLQLLSVLVHGYDNVGFDGWYQPVPHRPVDIITDVINDLGVRILQQYTAHGNVAFSPTGVGFVLAALYEGSAGRGRQQIADALGLPRDRDITRIGFRDIHRRLRTYLNADGFLGGLTLNHENTKLRPEYEDILRFYGFDLSIPEEDTNETTSVPETTTSGVTEQPTTEVTTSVPDETTVQTATMPTTTAQIPTTQTVTTQSEQSTERTSEIPMSTTPSVELLGMTLSTIDEQDRLTETTPAGAVSMGGTKAAATTLPSSITTSSTQTIASTTPTSPTTTPTVSTTTSTEGLQTTTSPVPPTTMPVITTVQSPSTESTPSTPPTLTSVAIVPTPPTTASQPSMSTTFTEASPEPTTIVTRIESVTEPVPESTTMSTTSSTTSGTTVVVVSSVETTVTPPVNVTEASTSSTIPTQADQTSIGPTDGPPADENTVSTDSANNQSISNEMGSTDLPVTTVATGEIGSTGQLTTVSSATMMNRRKRSYRSPRGFFSSYPDEGIWMQDLGIWKPFSPSLNEASVRDSTEISFLVNGCDVSSVTASRYFAVLPFAYFPSLHAVALEFPLDDPRYNIILMMATDRRDTYRLARDLGGKSLRLLRKQLQSTWVRATIPSFMLRGFVTLTSFLQRLGILDVFEPRAADLSPMTPDLGVYARDAQQSIGVNIRNYMKPDRTHSRNGLFERAGPVPFTVVQPFLYFIVDAETSVALIAGRVNDPLNSRIL